jgi:hypothetical protein
MSSCVSYSHSATINGAAVLTTTPTLPTLCDPVPFAYMARGVQTTLRYLAEDNAARMIVYAQNRKEVDQLSQALSCPAYYSDSGTDQEKKKTFKQWRCGSK